MDFVVGQRLAVLQSKLARPLADDPKPCSSMELRALVTRARQPKGRPVWGQLSLLVPLKWFLLVSLLLASELGECQRPGSRSALHSPEPTNSIFASLLGGGGGDTSSANGPSGNSTGAAALSQLAQQSAADLHQSYKNGQTSDKVTLPGDILLGGLFPIHMKGK